MAMFKTKYRPANRTPCCRDLATVRPSLTPTRRFENRAPNYFQKIVPVFPPDFIFEDAFMVAGY
jgi:hypothetical protein